MIVDDRLDTVLQTQAAGRAGLNTQFRQLVDLLGRTPDHAWTERHTAALDRLDTLHTALGDAAAAVLIGLCTLRNPRLIAHLVRRGPRTAIAAIARARIADAEWLQLVPDLPIHARGALRHRRDLSAPVVALLERLGIDDFVLSGPAPETAADSAAPEPPPPAVLVSLPATPPRRADAARPDSPAREGIGAIVRRIEAFRRHRQSEESTDPGQTRLPFADDPAADPPAIAIDVMIDAAGMIIGADGVDPALLVGHLPFVPVATPAAASVDGRTLRAFAAREPIVAGRLVLDGAPRIAGVWRIDAAPRFGSDGGQFNGYRARLRRPPQAAADPGPIPDLVGADSLQQLLHELRTPINAIQGFAELIQQQLLGPTPHQYRSLAASIAADAARMLAGFEDVERLVRLETGRAQIDPGEADLAAIMTRLATQLEPLVAPREIRLRWTVPADPVPIAIDPGEAERLLWRLLSTLTAAAAPGERLTLALALAGSEHDRMARVTMTLPQALALRDDEALFAPDIARAGNSGVGMLGHGFALRLAAAEVRSAGGRLERPGAPGSAMLEMTLPQRMPRALDRNRAAF
jgi:signal transduction histidine kinase